MHRIITISGIEFAVNDASIEGWSKKVRDCTFRNLCVKACTIAYFFGRLRLLVVIIRLKKLGTTAFVCTLTDVALNSP